MHEFMLGIWCLVIVVYSISAHSVEPNPRLMPHSVQLTSNNYCHGRLGYLKVYLVPPTLSNQVPASD